MATSTFFAPVTSTIATQQESSVFTTVNGSGLTFTLCDRTNSVNYTGNYFVSFNLPPTAAQLSSGSTLALAHPELFQLNVNQIVICPIPSIYLGEHLDGRSLTFTVPQISGATGISAKTIVSSTYATLQDEASNILLGSNIAFLFSDNLNLPYTGTTNNGIFSDSAVTTWNSLSYLNRPAATAYSELYSLDINSDKRPLSAITYAVPVTQAYPTSTNQGYNYDVPCGFIALDKGFVVFTHPNIVNSIPWTLGQNLYTNSSNSGAGSGTTNIYFSSTTNSQLTFNSIEVNFTTAIVAIALPQTFYFTNNQSWPLQANINTLNTGGNNFTNIYVTEIGLYNVNNELIALAKLSEPILKTYTNVLTFNININV
jgi:hypothetical protein